MQQLERLLFTYEQLGKYEKEMLAEFAGRILSGQRLYGELTPEKKNWTREALEEVLDCSFYMLALLKDKEGQ